MDIRETNLRKCKWISAPMSLAVMVSLHGDAIIQKKVENDTERFYFIFDDGIVAWIEEKINQKLIGVSSKDYQDIISQSELRIRMFENPQTGETGFFAFYIETFRDIRTNVTDEDLENSIIDEYGAKYSNDGTRLLWGPKDTSNYSIREGTIIVCDRAFYGCGFELKNICIPYSIKVISEQAFPHGYVFNIECFSPYLFMDKEVLLNGDLQSIVYCSPLLRKYDVPLFMEKINDEAFSKCRQLRYVKIPCTVNEIGKRCFDGCESLHIIDLTNSLIKIDDEAFRGCSSLQKVVLPESLKLLGNSVFEHCKCEIVNKSFSFNYVDGVLYSNNLDEIKYFPANKKKYKIPNSIKTIRGTFRNCWGLQEIILPPTLNSIDEESFMGCDSLQEVVIPDTVLTIKEKAFQGCKKLEKITFSSSLVSIGDEAFAGCDFLERIDIPNSVKEIGCLCFYGCTWLESITLSENLSVIREGTFMNCKKLRSITIPHNVSVIESGAFELCVNLQSVFFKANTQLYIIRERAFYDCKELINITIPNSVRIIEKAAFSGCCGLRYVYIPYSIDAIGTDIFNGCISLDLVEIDSPSVLNEDIFDIFNPPQKILIPKGRKTYIDNWSRYKTIIEEKGNENTNYE